MRELTMVKGGFWGGIIGAATGLLGCAFGALSYFGIGPDAVRAALGGWLHVLFPIAMPAFGFLFGFSVRHLVAKRSARKAQASFDEVLAEVEMAHRAEVDNLIGRLAASERERDMAFEKASMLVEDNVSDNDIDELFCQNLLDELAKEPDAARRSEIIREKAAKCDDGSEAFKFGLLVKYGCVEPVYAEGSPRRYGGDEIHILRTKYPGPEERDRMSEATISSEQVGLCELPASFHDFARHENGR